MGVEALFSLLDGGGSWLVYHNLYHQFKLLQPLSTTPPPHPQETFMTKWGR